MSRVAAGLLALLLAAPEPRAPQDAGAAAGDLAAGIALVKEGDFEAAVLKLDAAVQALEADPGAQADLATAYLYLGVAYLELDQELSARARFRLALGRDPILRLDPRQFSPQVIRVFEAVRAEHPPASPGPSPPAPAPAAVPPRQVPAAPPAEEKKSRKGLVFLLGGGAAAAGVALAVAAGGGGEPPTTGAPATTTPVGGTLPTTLPPTTMPEPPPTPAPSTTMTPPTTAPEPPPTTSPPATTLPPPPTTTPPTTTPPACSYGMTGPNPGNPQPAPGRGASCLVQATQGCAWSVAVAYESGGTDWITGLSPTSGAGTGIVSFQVVPNLLSCRAATINVAGQGASCRVQQDGVLGACLSSLDAAGSLSLASDLALEGGTGQVVLDGVQSLYQEPGLREIHRGTRASRGRVEATLVTALSKAGAWRFASSAFVPGTLRIVAGEAVLLTDDTVVFRLAGKPGERVVFVFETR
jgi:hypothetical protein